MGWNLGSFGLELGKFWAGIWEVLGWNLGSWGLELEKFLAGT